MNIGVLVLLSVGPLQLVTSMPWCVNVKLGLNCTNLLYVPCVEQANIRVIAENSQKRTSWAEQFR